MWDRIERLTAPAVEPLTLAEVKEACRIDGVDQDGFLSRATKAARELIEGPDGAGLVLIASRWRQRFDGFVSSLWLPMGPVIGIEGIDYVDAAGVLQTLPPAAYHWRKGRYEARIQPAHGLTWPVARRQYDAVQVTFTAGFPGTEVEPPSLGVVPEPLRIAMLMLIGHWHEHRETVVVGEIPAEVQLGYRDLVNRYRVGRTA
jgi:uncharacterized phiE125 gp8 family phage protein